MPHWKRWDRPCAARLLLLGCVCVVLAGGSSRGDADGAAPPAPGAPGSSEVCRLEGHEDIVWDACFSPDGRWVLSGGGGRCRPVTGPAGDFVNVTWEPGSDFALRLWDARTGKLERKFDGHTAGVGCVAFSPDGRQVLSGGSDNTLRLWNVQTAKRVREFVGHAGMVTAAVFSADGTRILSGARDGTVRLWDATTGAELRQFVPHPGPRIWDVALSPDGKTAAACGDQAVVHLWEVEGGKEVGQIAGHTQMTARVAFSPDGKTLASGGWDDTARLWEVATGKELLTLQGHTGRVEGITFSPDGRRLLTGSLDKALRLWDVRTGKLLKVMEGHTAPVARVAVSRDGRRAVSAGWDHTVRVWRLPALIDAGTASQVFPESYKPDPKLEAQLRRWVIELGGDDYPKREEAMLTLRRAGGRGRAAAAAPRPRRPFAGAEGPRGPIARRIPPAVGGAGRETPGRPAVPAGLSGSRRPLAEKGRGVAAERAGKDADRLRRGRRPGGAPQGGGGTAGEVGGTSVTRASPVSDPGHAIESGSVAPALSRKR